MKVLKKLYSGIKNVLASNIPKRRAVYAVTGGDYLGEFLIYVEERDGLYCFLSLPEMHVREITKADVMTGLDNKILDRVEKVPRDVFLLCCEQYAQSNKTLVTDDIVPRKDMSDD